MCLYLVIRRCAFRQLGVVYRSGRRNRQGWVEWSPIWITCADHHPCRCAST